VFVSYRKRDDPGWAGRLRDALARHFGADRVFFDVESIRGGQRWEDALDEALEASGALVLVIGPQWLDLLRARSDAGEVDHHLREITTALDRGIAICPVLVQGASMPSVDELPEVLRAHLPALQWREIYDTLFDASVGQVIADVERAVGPGVAAPPSPAPAAGATGSAEETITVGPRGSGADHHELAAAVAAAPAGATIHLAPGRYHDPVVIERPVSIEVTGPGSAVLDADAVPCLRSASASVAIRGLEVRSSARTGAVAIEVSAGDCRLDAVRVSAQWPEGATGISVLAEATRAHIVEASASAVDVGLRIAAGSVRLERMHVGRGTRHGLLVAEGGDPTVVDCRFEASSDATVRFEARSSGAIDGCAIGRGGRASVELLDGADPSLRGARAAEGASGAAGAFASVADRVARVRGEGASSPPVDHPDRGGWVVLAARGAAGTIVDADLAELRLEGAASTRVVRCGVAAVAATSSGGGTLEDCRIERVALAEGADPVLRGCTIEPPKGVKVTVEVRSGAAGTFDGCEIVGRNVRDGSPDPAVLVDGGSPTLRATTVRNPGEGAVWLAGGGRVEVDGGEVRSSSGPALVIVDGAGTVRGGTVVRGGIRVDPLGSLVLERSQVEADGVTGLLLVVARGATLEADHCQLRGPSLAAARTVGRWIETRSERTRGKVAGVLGSAPPVRVAEGARATFRGCSLTGIGRDGLVLPASGVDLLDTTVDGSPRG
jgi:hypothetical protein